MAAKSPITVRHELDETKIVPLVAELHGSHDIVVIDTAGAASQATIFAIGCADLALVPIAPSAARSATTACSDVLKGQRSSDDVFGCVALWQRRRDRRKGGGRNRDRNHGSLMDYARRTKVTAARPHDALVTHMGLVRCGLL